MTGGGSTAVAVRAPVSSTARCVVMQIGPGRFLMKRFLFSRRLLLRQRLDEPGRNDGGEDDEEDRLEDRGKRELALAQRPPVIRHPAEQNGRNGQGVSTDDGCQVE